MTAVLVFFAGTAAACRFSAQAVDDPVSAVENSVDGILDYYLFAAGCSNAQEWIDTELSQNAGVSAEWKILALSQLDDLDFTNYENALMNFLFYNEVSSATTREKYALSLTAVGSSDSYIAETIDNATGGQGVMSVIFGLHLLNNGFTSEIYRPENVVRSLLSLRKSDGGWAVIGNRSDVDVTAMAIQSLAPYYQSDVSVFDAVETALGLLSEKQLSDGSMPGFQGVNCESTAQVITALSCLGVDLFSDPRFIKDGHTLFDGLSVFQTDGGYAHFVGGEKNETATEQAFYSLVSLLRACHGWGNFYIFDNRSTRPAHEEPWHGYVGGAGSSPNSSSSGNISQNNDDHNVQSGDSSQGKSLYEDTSEGDAFQGGAPEQRQGGNSDDGQAEAAESRLSGGDPSAVELHESGTTQPSTVMSAFETENTSPTDSTASFTDSAVDETSVSETAPDKQHAAATPTENIVAAGEAADRNDGYKPVAIIVILVITLAVCAVLFLMRKRHPKNFITVGAVAAAAILIVLFTNIQSRDDFYDGVEKTKDNAVGEVTLSIDCLTLSGKELPDHLPKNCVILEDTAFSIEEGETVLDILNEAARRYSIQVDNTGTAAAAYIAGIDWLYEFDFGELSGWMYVVNGETPSVGCGEYTLHDGDRVQWKYTCALGEDLIDFEP